MKRLSLILISIISTALFFIPVTYAQEKQEKSIETKIEKKIKIITVDEEGEKVVIDTIVTGDTDLEEIFQGEGVQWTVVRDAENRDKGDNIFIMKRGDSDNFSIISIDEKQGKHEKQYNVYIDEDITRTEDGNVVFKSGSSNSHNYIVKADNDGEKKMNWIEKDDLEEGEIHIIIRSGDELQNLYIKGDAVITIKDGQINYEGDSVKMKMNKSIEIKKEGDKKVEKVLKKEVKKQNK